MPRFYDLNTDGWKEADQADVEVMMDHVGALRTLIPALRKSINPVMREMAEVLRNRVIGKLDGAELEMALHRLLL